jgi:hypothetical protein
MTHLPPIGARVKITDTADRGGVVVGHGTATVTYAKYPATFAIVQLAGGFFSEDRDVFVGHLLVHPDNLEVVK